MQATQSPALADIDAIRAEFPALASSFAFLENAGGSQVPACVADAIREYMLTSYVQLGAGYETSKQCTETVARAHQFMNEFMNGTSTGKAILGPSTTQLVAMLAGCYEKVLQQGDEIIVAETAHEANAGPWVRLADKGCAVKIWKVDPESFQCSLEDLEALLTRRTKIVAFPHVSNLLGEVVDVPSITELAHRYGAKVVVDGVAYAPHRAIDVKAWEVDFYVFSTYKVYGPHMAALYGKHEALEELTGPNHFFVPKDDVYKFELGGPSHEACAGLLAVGDYLKAITGRTTVDHETVRLAYDRMTALELPIQRRLLWFLLQKPGVRVIGPTSSNSDRVPTISFVHDRLSADEIVAVVDKREIGIRYGHMYAYRMCEALGIDLQRGVVRVSAVHYNTVEEIDRLTDVLDEIL